MKLFYCKIIVLLTFFINSPSILYSAEASTMPCIQDIVESIIAAKQKEVIRECLVLFRKQDIAPVTVDEVGTILQTLVILMPSDHSCLEYKSAQQFKLFLEQRTLKRFHHQLHNGPQRVALLDDKYQAIREIAGGYYSILRLQQADLNQYTNPDGWTIDLDSLLEMGPSTKINGPLVIKEPKVIPLSKNKSNDTR